MAQTIAGLLARAAVPCMILLRRSRKTKRRRRYRVGSPTKISNPKKIERVMKNGRWVGLTYHSEYVTSVMFHV